MAIDIQKPLNAPAPVQTFIDVLDAILNEYPDEVIEFEGYILKAEVLRIGPKRVRVAWTKGKTYIMLSWATMTDVYVPMGRVDEARQIRSYIEEKKKASQ